MKKYLLLPVSVFAFNIVINAQNWEAFGYSPQDARALFNDTIDNSLYIGGQFTWFSGQEARGIIKWNGQAFSTLGVFPNVILGSSCQPVISIIRYKNEIYCTLTNGPWQPGEIRGLARWDGVSWDSIAGITGFVFDQFVFNDKLYILGGFRMAENDTAGAVIRWDGQNWYDTGFRSWLEDYDAYNVATCAVEFNGELYVGGSFWQGETTAIDVARFDGQNWHIVGGGIQGGFDDVADLIVYKGELYACGDFKKSSGNAGNLIMKLKGNQWVDVGGSFQYESGIARSMVIYHDKLYVVGNFNNVVGGISVNNIAVWDGERWCSLGSEFNKGISDAVVYEDDIIIAGGWEYIDGDTIYSVARWLGKDYLAECGDPVSANDQAKESSTFSIAPNPVQAGRNISINISTPYRSIAILTAYNLLGQIIWQENIPTDIQTTIDVSAWPCGVYFFSLEAGGQVWVEKMIVQ